MLDSLFFYRLITMNEPRVEVVGNPMAALPPFPMKAIGSNHQPRLDRCDENIFTLKSSPAGAIESM